MGFTYIKSPHWAQQRSVSVQPTFKALLLVTCLQMLLIKQTASAALHLNCRLAIIHAHLTWWLLVLPAQALWPNIRDFMKKNRTIHTLSNVSKGPKRVGIFQVSVAVFALNDWKPKKHLSQNTRYWSRHRKPAETSNIRYTVGGISANTRHYASGVHKTTKNKLSYY